MTRQTTRRVGSTRDRDWWSDRSMALPQVYFEKLLESSPDIVVAVDRRGAIIFYNDGARQTLGYASQEVLSEPVTLLYASLDEAKRVMAAMRGGEHGGRGRIKNFETVFTAKDREQIPVAISGSVIYDAAGQEIGSIGFAKDLRQIRRRDRLATLGELAVSLAHEINNPLEVITNTMNLLEDFARQSATDEEMVLESERFETVHRELEKIHAIVSRVQELAAGEEYETRQYLPGTLMTDLRQGPKTVPQPVSGRTSSSATVPAATPNGADASLEGLRILVVDDDLGVCRSLAELLRHQGCEAAVTTSASEALGLVAQHHFDLVVSDVVMPDMDGYDLFMELKVQQPELPVILMTGYLYDRDHVIKRSKLAGLDSRVLYKKPIDPERLKTAILTHCTRGKPASAAPAGNPGHNPSPA